MSTFPLLNNFLELFEKKLQEKNSWGKNEVLALVKDCKIKILADALMKLESENEHS